jgi:hypothetical protein
MSDEDQDSWGDPAFEEAVRETAYFLWEQDGRPFGKETDYWYEALERTLRQRKADQELARQALVHPTGQVDDNKDDLGRPITETGD